MNNKFNGKHLSLEDRKIIEEGIEKGKLETARNLLSDGVSIDKIVKATGLSEKDILDSDDEK